MAELTWVPAERIESTSGRSKDEHDPWTSLQPHPRQPLSGLKVLCVTHAIAGPSAGRTLAEHGASVLQVMITHGFEHHFVYTYANLGCASTRMKLHKRADRQRLQTLVEDAHVWIDPYRPLSIDKFGFSDEDIRTLNHGMINARVRCYGTIGPWSSKSGSDMQGSASSGMIGYVSDDDRPKWPPGMVINDYTAGYSTALAIQSILLERFRDDVNPSNEWRLSPILTGTAMASSSTSRLPKLS
ncbi:CoA-transferase family III [Setomelanomma holmii]|uniref:CoA-transferase family III n=1 Tax=Setomelanomma holmii TaxID=210430 RepID=A0A9P4HBS8_9PLEO|nr:CoA-transferase family III [Setomelanomma holmii]